MGESGPRNEVDITLDLPSERVPGLVYPAAHVRVCHLPAGADDKLLYSGHLIRGGSCVVGRDPACDLRPLDPTLSRRHVKIEVGAFVEKCTVADLGSHNGTWVNGEPVTCDGVTVTLPCVVRAAQVVLVVQAGSWPPACATDGHWVACTMIDDGVVGTSAAMLDLVSRLGSLAATSSPVVLVGETGTGKEVLARLIHRRSGRKGDFVPVLASAIPETVAQSALFGHIRGAFTGAVAHGAGLLAKADRGTVFFDELADMPVAFQEMLLRVLQDGMLSPVGASARPSKIDVRVVAATNRSDLLDGPGAKVRGDLLFRLSGQAGTGARLEIPPLRRRPEDALPLFHEFCLRSHNYRSMGATCAEGLVTYGWPGNVRELENLVSRLPGGSARELEIGDLPEAVWPVRTRKSAAVAVDAAVRLDGTTKPARETSGTPASVPETTEFTSTADIAIRYAEQDAASPALVPTAELPAMASPGPRPDGHPRVRCPETSALEALVAGHCGNVAAIARELGVRAWQVRRWLKGAGLMGLLAATRLSFSRGDSRAGTALGKASEKDGTNDAEKERKKERKKGLTPIVASRSCSICGLPAAVRQGGCVVI